MQQIADWLNTLGMSEYAERFAENDIDFTILGDLTDQDLEKIGVVSLGHRRKLLRAIADLKVIEKNESGAVAPVAFAGPRPQDSGERRQVTVMFSDLVGSTALSARMDPEDLRDIISAYQQCVTETVQRFGGFVAKYMGDGVLIYFGYPRAQEDDVERSVRSAPELIAAVSALKAPVSLQTRVGIATGLVVVGDLIGSGEAQERGIVGETPNLAARLQSIAEPNMVVIAESTRKQLGQLFELEDLGAKELKGISGPVCAWAALRPSLVESRFEALRAVGLTDLVGREKELELLLRQWSQTKSGCGQVVLIAGEPGIGKSRLVADLLEKLAPEPHTSLRYFCSPQHTDSALYPVITLIKRSAGLAHSDTLTAKLDKLDALLAQTATTWQDAALFADMLSLANDGRYPALDLTPQQRRQKTLKALGAQPETLARQQPVLILFEDAHWADPTSLELLSVAVDQSERLPVMLIVTYRPEFRPPWLERRHVTALTVDRLTQDEIAAMIDRVAGDSLPDGVRRDIIERADGIPLFAEEITRAVLEAEGESRNEDNTASQTSAILAVPTSLHASLLARLDHLGEAKEIAQIGASIGREFSHELLAAVASKSRADLDSALERLITSGLLFQMGKPPDASYWFKHALVRDAAYDTLLRRRRRELHCRIVSVLQQDFADVAASQPELLAYHCTQAGMIVEAVEYYLAAGQCATAAFNNMEAAAHLNRGLNVLEQLPASDPRKGQLRQQFTLSGWWFA